MFVARLVDVPSSSPCNRSSLRRHLLELLRRWMNSADVEALLQEALRGALELIPQADAGSVLVRDQAGYRYAGLAGFEGVRFSLEQAMAGYGGSMEEALQAHARVYRMEQHSSGPQQLDTAMADLHWRLVVPIPFEGRVEALLNLDRSSSEPFSPEALELAEELGKSLEVALSSLRDRERLRQRLQREEALSRVLASLAGFTDAEALWASLPQLVADFMPVALASALRREGEALRVVSSLRSEPPVGYLLPRGKGISWQALEKRRVLFAPCSDPAAHRLEVPRPERYYAAFVPLFDPQGEPLGVLAFHNEHPFAADDEALLRALAQGVGNALSKLEAQSRELVRLGTLAQATRALGPARSAEEVYRRTVEEALRQTGAVSAILSRLNLGESSLEVVAAAGLGAERAVGLRFYHGQGVAWEVYRNRAPLFIPDISKIATAQFASGKRSAGAYLGVPLSDPEGQFIGVLSVDTAGGDPHRVGQLGPGDRYILEVLAEVAGVAISRLSALEQSQRQAADYRSLVQMSAEIELMSHPHDIARRALETLLELTGFEAGGLFQLEVDPSGEGSLIPVVGVGQYPERYLSLYRTSPIRLGRGVLGKALLEGTLVIPDYQTWPHAPSEYRSSGIRSVMAVRLTQGDRSVGVLALGTFTQPRMVSQEHLALLVSVARRLERALERAAHLEEITRTREAALRALGLGLELRDLETKGHTDRVVALSVALRERLGFADLEGLRLGAYLHDLGKLAVPDEVLQKNSPLSTGEWRVMKTHPEIGYEMLRELSFLPEVALNVVRYHHERSDGSGYPLGLRGEEIPLEARIFAVVDIYDALSHARPYKPAWPLHAVRRELESQAGKTLDAEVVRAFIDLLAQPA
ncbi:metal dependent phosphohydrolase [Allomeiothermus silvanus DSM 9946]|uniref:Metal dependent phosphohydrolase n=1 Tax=Allomeiothermus silvanus (strain ATCC 700542 / DSM 9946 / NBRC 106475 / NCIMB 13440 / VI-R2) TaxID=526227 RepID=D7BE91_ALLS1|nr:metal dependent phosphohydrolase [Allomeiothermus silvanus DSM 9946]